MIKRIALSLACAATLSGASAPPPALDDLLTCSAYGSFLSVVRMKHADQVKLSEKDAQRRGYRTQEYACAVSEKKPKKWWDEQTAQAMVRMRDEVGKDWSNLGPVLASYDALCGPIGETAEHYLSENKDAGCHFSADEEKEDIYKLLEPQPARSKG